MSCVLLRKQKACSYIRVRVKYFVCMACLLLGIDMDELRAVVEAESVIVYVCALEVLFVYGMSLVGSRYG